MDRNQQTIIRFQRFDCRCPVVSRRTWQAGQAGSQEPAGRRTWQAGGPGRPGPEAYFYRSPRKCQRIVIVSVINSNDWTTPMNPSTAPAMHKPQRGTLLWYHFKINTAKIIRQASKSFNVTMIVIIVLGTYIYIYIYIYIHIYIYIP